MSVTTRTNLATTGSAASTANWAAIPGTSGGAGLTNQTGTAAFGTTFNRVTWSTGTTVISGGLSYTLTGLAANTQYSHQIWIRCSKTQRLQVKVDYRNSSNTIVNTVYGTVQALTTPNTWSQFTVTGTSGAAVTNMVLTVQAATGGYGVNWLSGDWLDGDAVCIETAPTPGPYFDGSFPNAASTIYAWTGAAGNSTSTATLYQPVITAVAKTDAPCPRVELTISDLDPSTDVVNVWRTADGIRQAVRGARRRSVIGSDSVVDYEAPLGRSLAYDLDVVSGVCALAPVTTATATVASSTWWIQDPLVPSSAIPLNVSKQDSTAPYLSAAAVKSLEYDAAVTLIPILGSPDPVALTGERQSAGNVTFDMFTNLASVTTQLRNLIKQTPLLLVRSNGVRNDGIPGLAYFSCAKPVEKPVTVAFGGTLTTWALTGDLVAAPTMNVLVPFWTYGTVQALWLTYQQAQTTLAGKTYLDVLKSPSGV